MTQIVQFPKRNTSHGVSRKSDRYQQGGHPTCNASDTRSQVQTVHVKTLMDKAWASQDVNDRVCLAQQVLDIDKKCLDALTVMAMHAPSEAYDDPIVALEDALECAENRLREAGVFEENLGHFWQNAQTRSYLRALGALARLYRRHGRFHQAIAALQCVLALDERDTQGQRYALASLLIREGDYNGFHVLDRRFKGESSVMFLFNRALVAYIQKGRGSEAESLVRRALIFNPEVPFYLEAEPDLPMPEQAGLGRGVMAWLYAKENRDIWRRTPGALRWLVSLT